MQTQFGKWHQVKLSFQGSINKGMAEICSRMAFTLFPQNTVLKKWV